MSKIPLPEKQGVLMEEVARTLGNSLKVCEKHYAKWVQSRQDRLDSLVVNVESIGIVLNIHATATSKVPIADECGVCPRHGGRS